MTAPEGATRPESPRRGDGHPFGISSPGTLIVARSPNAAPPQALQTDRVKAPGGIFT